MTARQIVGKQREFFREIEIFKNQEATRWRYHRRLLKIDMQKIPLSGFWGAVIGR